MSATRFIVAATPRSSARRLARTVGSSAITITSSKKRSTVGLAVASALQRRGEVAVGDAGLDQRAELVNAACRSCSAPSASARAVDGAAGLARGLAQDVDDALVGGGERQRPPAAPRTRAPPPGDRAGRRSARDWNRRPRRPGSPCSRGRAGSRAGVRRRTRARLRAGARPGPARQARRTRRRPAPAATALRLRSIRMRITPSAARRRPNGSLSPVGAWPIPNMPTSVSSLSASATDCATRALRQMRRRRSAASSARRSRRRLRPLRRRAARSSGPSCLAAREIRRPCR